MSPPQLFDQSGRSVIIGRKLGEGGEGAVFEVANIGDVVAKVYHKPATAEKAAKLSAIVSHSTPELSRAAAWPISMLQTKSAMEVRGVLMPRVDHCASIHELYSPADRRAKFPDAKWQFLIRTAMNCAVVFEKLHADGVVIGDVNQGNVLVGKNALVRLIDCDSFQVRQNGRVFRCSVGVPHFTPPELQGGAIDFAKVDRTSNHDRFGLAVLIFHLLLMGRHPFAGRYAGAGEMPIERAIEQFRFAYGRRAATLQMTPPPHALSILQLPTKIADLFERAFERGSEQPDHRPSPVEWRHALSEFDHHLNGCDLDPGHQFATGLTTCPWCDIVRNGGPNFFISVTIRALTGANNQPDIGGLWAAIEMVSAPRESRYAGTSPPTPVGTPLPGSVLDSSSFIEYSGVACISVALFCLGSLAFPPLLVVGVVLQFGFGSLWIALTMLSPLGKIRRARISVAARRREELRAAISALNSSIAGCLSEFEKHRELLRGLRDKFSRVSSDENTEISALQSSVMERQRRAYLQGHLIRDARISLVAESRKMLLASYGIETALDVELSRIKGVPGFGEVTTANLIAWRMQVESGFRFDSSKGVPQCELDAVKIKYFQVRQQILIQLKQGPSRLRGIRDAADRDTTSAIGRLGKLEQDWAQAKADVAICFSGRTRLWLVAAVLISTAISVAVLCVHGARRWRDSPANAVGQVLQRPNVCLGTITSEALRLRRQQLPVSEN